MPSNRKSMSDRLSNTPGKRSRFPSIFPLQWQVKRRQAKTPASVRQEEAGVTRRGWKNQPAGTVNGGTRGQKGETKDPLVDKSCMRVHPERPRSYSWNIQPDNCSKDDPADVKFPQRPLRNNVTTAMYRSQRTLRVERRICVVALYRSIPQSRFLLRDCVLEFLGRNKYRA